MRIAPPAVNHRCLAASSSCIFYYFFVYILFFFSLAVHSWVYSKCFGLVIFVLLYNMLLLLLSHFWTNKHHIIMMMMMIRAVRILGLIHACWRTYIIFVSYRNCMWAQAVASIHTHIYTLVVVDFDNKTRWQLMTWDRHCQVRDLLLSVICWLFFFFSLQRRALVLNKVFLRNVLTIFRATSPGGAAAKYCDDHVCVSVCLSVCKSVCLSVCLSVRQHISGATRAIFTNFLCMLPIAVARSSSFRVTKPQGEWTVWGFTPYWQCIVRHSLQKRVIPYRPERVWWECTARAKCDLRLPC